MSSSFSTFPCVCSFSFAYKHIIAYDQGVNGLSWFEYFKYQSKLSVEFFKSINQIKLIKFGFCNLGFFRVKYSYKHLINLSFKYFSNPIKISCLRCFLRKSHKIRLLLLLNEGHFRWMIRTF